MPWLAGNHVEGFNSLLLQIIVREKKNVLRASTKNSQAALLTMVTTIYTTHDSE